MSGFEGGRDLSGGLGAQRDAAYEAITVEVSIHVVLAVGHEQAWVRLKPASIKINLLEFSTKTGNRERNKST